MEFSVHKLSEMPHDIIKIYADEFILPLNLKANSGIIIHLDEQDTEYQIEQMCKLISLTRIALVVVRISSFFLDEILTTPYSFMSPQPKIVLSCEERQKIRAFQDILIQENLYRELEYLPDVLLFGMCHEGLIFN